MLLNRPRREEQRGCDFIVAQTSRQECEHFGFAAAETEVILEPGCLIGRLASPQQRGNVRRQRGEQHPVAIREIPAPTRAAEVNRHARCYADSGIKLVLNTGRAKELRIDREPVIHALTNHVRDPHDRVDPTMIPV
jgi:hypothetical protein